MKICLDAGHGEGYNQSPALPAYREGTRMFLLQRYLAQELRRYGFEVLCTRTTLQDDPDLLERGSMAKGCDLLLSLHSNAVGSQKNEAVDYVRVYYPVSGAQEALAREMADLIAAVMGTNQAPQHSQRWNSKHNADYYGIIRHAVAVGTPALLLEHSFHTNTRSTAWLLEDENLHRLAAAEAALLAEYYEMEEKTLRYELLKDIQDQIYRPVVEKLLDLGLLRGKGGCGENTIIDLGEDALRLLVILDRAGLFPLEKGE